MIKNFFIKNRKYILWILFTIGCGFLVFSKVDFFANAQTTNARFYFSPESKEFRKGCQYSVEIMVDPGSNTSNAANIYVDYDPSQIEIIDSNSTYPGKQINPGNAYEAYADNVVDETAGRIRLTGFSIMYPLRDVKSFGTIEFRSKGNTSSATFTIWFDGVGRTLDSNIAETNTSMDILGSVGSATYTFVDGPCIDDTNPPTISPVRPRNYQVGVPLDSSIEVRICDNREWDSGVDLDTIEVIVNGVVYTNLDLDAFAVSGNPSCYDIVVRPRQSFPADEAVTVTFKASDFRGNSSTRSIIFNIPAEISECSEEIEKIVRELETCEERVCLVTLPEGGITQVLRDNEQITDSIAAVPLITGLISILPTFGFSIFELPYYLLQLFLWLLNLLGIKRKGTPWGVVYDSVTKTPIARAVVRLFSQGNLVESRVTDINGVFYFTPKQGIYTLIASKQDYTFPSTTIVTETDGAKSNIYRGGPYQIKSDKDIVRISIPLDPVKASATKVFMKKLWAGMYSFIMMLNPYILIFGIIFSIVAYSVTGELMNIVWLVLNTIFLILHFYVKYLMKSRWGYVVDQLGNPVIGVEVGVYDNIYNRLVDTRVTDEKGRYSFVLPGDTYTVKPASGNFVIDDPKHESGYIVGKKTKSNVLINQKIVVRRIG